MIHGGEQVRVLRVPMVWSIDALWLNIIKNVNQQAQGGGNVLMSVHICVSLFVYLFALVCTAFLP